MHAIRLIRLWALIGFASLLVGAQAYAQTSGEADYVTAITTASEELRSVGVAIDGELAEDELNQLRLRTAGARSSALDAVETMQKELELVSEREAQLGPKPAGEEPPDILAQRQDLTQRRGILEAAIKRGRLVAVEAQQLTDRLKASRAEQISTEVSARVNSPVLPRFWITFGQNAPGDLGRLSRLLMAEQKAFTDSLLKNGWWAGLIGLTAAVLIAWPLRLMVRKAGQKLLVRWSPEGRVRRSSYAMWRLVFDTLLPSVAAFAFVSSLRWAGLITGRWEPIADAFTTSFSISSYITALAGALLMRGQPSWRLLPIGDDLAAGLRQWTWLLAGMTLIHGILQAVSVAMSASPPAMALMQMFIAAFQVFLFTGILLTLARLRVKAARSGEDSAPKQTSLALLGLLAWLVIIVSVCAVLGGYVAFSLFVVRLITWAVIVIATVYMISLFIDDLITTAFCADSPLGHLLVSGVGVRPALIDQAGVLLSGALRVMLAFLALCAVLFPFGSGVDSIVEQVAALADGIKIGEMTLSPAAVGRAVVVLVVGAALVRMLQGWLDTRYLPKTSLDAGAKNSISMVTRYVGLILAVLWALASLGIGMERIALLLSALSVGIGFGLQAITQNFVSGLILLAERPVKIGDLVRIGTDEGDVKRINVRSTEIELADHSTLIVPNSELITKSVLNKTHANPLGRIQIQFSIPVGDNVAAVRAMVLSAFTDEARVLEKPAPSVFIDNIVDGRIHFNCFAHVAGPRDAYSARSSILLDLLQRFYKEGIEVGTVPQKLELSTPLPEIRPADVAEPPMPKA